MMMQTDRVAIVGAGPSGAFLARLLSDAGYKVTVFEALPKLAVKPCGWGVPFTIDRVVKIPEDYIISEVHGYRVHIDEEKLLESKGVKYGYIVDKERLLEHFLEGVEVVRRGVRELGKLEGYDLVVDARGVSSYPGRRASALQAIVEGVASSDSIEVHLLTGFTGYAWIFPLGGSRAKAGVGGLADFETLRSYLSWLLKLHGNPEVRRLEGGSIAAGGIIWRAGAVKIGEALGAVQPLSGEGIRPGMLSSLALFRSLRSERSFSEELRRTGLPFNIKVQLAIVRRLESLSPEGRANLYRTAPREILERVTAGNLTPSYLARAAARWPGFFAKVAGPRWLTAARQRLE